MKRKIVLILIAIILLSLPFQSTYHQVEATVGSKAATLTAKKIVKEVIQEAAINQAANMAVLEAIAIADKYQTKPGYKIVCPSGGSTCDKPVQVKSTLTEADKTAIKGQSAIELDKLISPNGKGFSRWQSFLDWFLPIWLVTFAMTALTYAIDSDFRNLLNEAGYNALVALGIIVPMTTNETIPIETVDMEDVDKTIPGTPKPTSYYHNEYSNSYSGSATHITPNLNWENKEVMMQTTLPANNPYGSTFQRFIYTVNGLTLFGILTDTNNTGRVYIPGTFSTGVQSVKVKENGVVTSEMNAENSALQTELIPFVLKNTSINIRKTISVRSRLPYEINGFWYTDTLLLTADGQTVEFQYKNNENKYTSLQTIKYETTNSMNPVNVHFSAKRNVMPFKEEFPPPYEEVAPVMDMVATTPYQSDDGERIALIPPTAITYQDETTGETVERKPNATGDGIVFEKPDGTIVPEENVVPNDPPEVVKDPQGVPTVTPSPTPSNPAPEPIPLTPGQTVTEPTPDGNPPPGSTPPTGTEEPPLEPFPEGEKCLEKLKFPIFSPLKEQLQTSFPFSIPWDIERAAQAAFGGISSEKPSFEMPMVIFGETHEVTITTPKFMDDWKPFTDSLLLITFDILIMFGLYRFVKGAGS